MDLTRQPPRRPSNTKMAGIVGLARMTDKARAHNEETLEPYVYGNDSNLDTEVLALIGMQAEEFAEAAEAMSDEELVERVRERINTINRTQEEIDVFNRERIEREPHDERHRELLRERLAQYAPGRTDIKTIFASLELDDWGQFCQMDLTQEPPRTAYLRSVFGVMGAARMADKARAARAGMLGAYRYGRDSGLDAAILDFLGLEADDFMEAAYAHPNDTELGEWIVERVEKTPAEKCAFNAMRAQFGRLGEARSAFLRRKEEVGCDWGEVDTFFDLMDFDDEKSFGIVDLRRHAPRSIYDVSVGGVAGLARIIDKARAAHCRMLGAYWFGDDSEFDRQILQFIGTAADEFSAAIKECDGDDAVWDWLRGRVTGKDPGEIEAFNISIWTFYPRSEDGLAFIRKAVGALDPRRRDIDCFAAVTELDDRVFFARMKAGV